MAATNTVLDLLADEEFAETASVMPFGSSSWTTGITVRMRREPPQIIQQGHRGEIHHKGTVVCLSTVHATYKGLVSPQSGDRWTLNKQQGDATTSATEWMAGAPQPCVGGWQIPVTYLEITDLGKTRKAGVA